MAAYRAVEIFVHDTVERILGMRLERAPVSMFFLKR